MRLKYVGMLLPLEFIDEIEKAGDEIDWDDESVTSTVIVRCFKEVYDQIKNLKEDGR